MADRCRRFFRGVRGLNSLVYCYTHYETEGVAPSNFLFLIFIPTLSSPFDNLLHIRLLPLHLLLLFRRLLIPRFCLWRLQRAHWTRK